MRGAVSAGGCAGGFFENPDQGTAVPEPGLLGNVGHRNKAPLHKGKSLGGAVHPLGNEVFSVSFTVRPRLSNR